MRWGRFRGLLFAPVFAVNAGAGGRSRALQTPCRVRSRLAICPWMRKVRIGARLQGGLRRCGACHGLCFAKHCFFAPCLIAAKPVKPCDGGVFWIFYLLLVSEQAARRARLSPNQTQPEPSSNPARTQPEPSPNLVQTQMGFRRLAYALCSRDELGFALSRLRHGCSKPRFWSPLSAGP